MGVTSTTNIQQELDALKDQVKVLPCLHSTTLELAPLGVHASLPVAPRSLPRPVLRQMSAGHERWLDEAIAQVRLSTGCPASWLRAGQTTLSLSTAACTPR